MGWPVSVGRLARDMALLGVRKLSHTMLVIDPTYTTKVIHRIDAIHRGNSLKHKLLTYCLLGLVSIRVLEYWLFYHNQLSWPILANECLFNVPNLSDLMLIANLWLMLAQLMGVSFIWYLVPNKKALHIIETLAQILVHQKDFLMDECLRLRSASRASFYDRLRIFHLMAGNGMYYATAGLMLVTVFVGHQRSLIELSWQRGHFESLPGLGKFVCMEINFCLYLLTVHIFFKLGSLLFSFMAIFGYSRWRMYTNTASQLETIYFFGKSNKKHVKNTLQRVASLQFQTVASINESRPLFGKIIGTYLLAVLPANASFLYLLLNKTFPPTDYWIVVSLFAFQGLMVFAFLIGCAAFHNKIYRFVGIYRRLATMVLKVRGPSWEEQIQNFTIHFSFLLENCIACHSTMKKIAFPLGCFLVPLTILLSYNFGAKVP